MFHGAIPLDCLRWVPWTGKSALVEVEQHPEALIFRGIVQGELHARICGVCGHTALYIDNPGELWQAYRQSRKS